MINRTDAPSGLRQWCNKSESWLAAALLLWLLGLVGGVIIVGMAALLAQILLWGTIATGMRQMRAAHNCPAEQADARQMLILLFVHQLVSLLYLAWLWLNLINIDLNTH